jgi:hypothetical protein
MARQEHSIFNANSAFFMRLATVPPGSLYGRSRPCHGNAALASGETISLPKYHSRRGKLPRAVACCYPHSQDALAFTGAPPEPGDETTENHL